MTLVATPRAYESRVAGRCMPHTAQDMLASALTMAGKNAALASTDPFTTPPGTRSSTKRSLPTLLRWSHTDTQKDSASAGITSESAIAEPSCALTLNPTLVAKCSFPQGGAGLMSQQLQMQGEAGMVGRLLECALPG